MHNNDSDIIRVLHMIGSFEIGGSQMMVLNLYKAINREKIQFDFILDHAEAVALVPEVKALGARIYILPQFKGHNFFEVCKAWDDFFVKHPEYRILHSHVRSYASLYIPIAQRHGLKTIIHSHNTSNGKGVVSGIKKIMQYPLRYQADYFFACSEEAGKWLFGKQVLKTDCFRIISNGIDCERFRFNKLYRDSIRKEVGITNNFVIGHVGRHTTQKNPLFLIEVFAEIYRKDRNVRLLQVGQGEMTDQIKKKCQKLGIEDVVIFVGARKDIEKYYSAMDIFLFPSLWEGTPVTLVEAQTNGLLCVISSGIADIADIGAGLLYTIPQSSSKEVWAEAVVNLKNRKRCLDANEYTKHAGYDVLHVARELEQFYFEIENSK